MPPFMIISTSRVFSTGKCEMWHKWVRKRCSLKAYSFDEMPCRNLEARTGENQKLPSSILTTGQDTKDPKVQAGLVLEGRD